MLCHHREVAALGRSLAAVGGRLDSLLVAATSQGLSDQAGTPETILTGTSLCPVIGWECLHPCVTCACDMCSLLSSSADSVCIQVHGELCHLHTLATDSHLVCAAQSIG